MSGASGREIWKWRSGKGLTHERDALAAEEPLEIRVNGQSVSVTMRTPGNDEELAAGFLFTEALVRKREDIHELRRDEKCPNIVDVILAPSAKFDIARLSRHVFASSSCGICGKATIESVHQNFPPAMSELTISAGVLQALPARLRADQAAFEETGGIHAAAVFTETGDLLAVREDVGRHNALDKVIGCGLLGSKLPYDKNILLVSGRASFELVQKALAAKAPILAAVSAASDLAAQFAADSGITLVGFLRDGRMNIYSHPERVKF